jgi:hypothetical protein
MDEPDAPLGMSISDEEGMDNHSPSHSPAGAIGMESDQSSSEESDGPNPARKRRVRFNHFPIYCIAETFADQLHGTVHASELTFELIFSVFNSILIHFSYREIRVLQLLLR